MTDHSPLSDAELKAAREAQERRTLSLRSRGWQRPAPYTRSDLYNWHLDRELRRIHLRKAE